MERKKPSQSCQLLAAAGETAPTSYRVLMQELAWRSQQDFPEKAQSKPPVWDSEWAHGNSQWQLAVPRFSLLYQSAVASVLFVSLHFRFGRLFWAVYNCLLVANGHEFLDARGCLASSSEKALTGQRPSGLWLWLIRVLVTTPQFPLLALWSHRCYSSCVIFNPLPQPLPESSSSTVFKSLNIRFKKVKPTLFLSALPGPFSVLVPGCSAQPAQHLAICDVTHQPTDLSWVVLWDLGLASPCPASSCLSFIAWHRAMMAKMFFLKETQQVRPYVYFLTNLSVQPSPKRATPSALFAAVPSRYGSHCSISRYPLHPDTP